MRRPAVLCLTLLAATPSAAGAAGVALPLPGAARYVGVGAGHQLGSAITAGDLTGDGRPDLVMAAHGATFGGGGSGAVYVATGGAPTSPVDLTTPPADVWRIDGPPSGGIGSDAGIASVDVAGDTDGDGFGDLVVGARGVQTSGGTRQGAVYIVHGEASPADLALATPGGRATLLLGDGPAGGNPNTGTSVSGLGDVNGDGLDDVGIVEHVSGTAQGRAYVVFGSASRATVDLAALGTRGFRITGLADIASRLVVSDAGDLDGDGLADIAIGAKDTTVGGNDFAGRVHLVAGRATTADVDVTTPGSTLATLDGATGNVQAGSWVSRLGDVDGDGRGDLLVGGLGGGVGAWFVVFGSPTPTSRQLSQTAAGPGYARIRRALFNSLAPAGAEGRGASAGDFDGDGLDDIVLGDPTESHGGVLRGAAHVVLGRTTWTDMTLDALPDGSPPDGTIRIEGDRASSELGRPAAVAVGDVTGDGAVDLAVSQAFHDGGGGNVGRGLVGIVPGTAAAPPPPPPPPPPPVDPVDPAPSPPPVVPGPAAGPGPAPSASPTPSAPTPQQTLLACAGGRIAVLDVTRSGARVLVAGQARPSDAGARLEIVLRARPGARATVAGRGVVAADGGFRVTVRAPARALRPRAAYAARLAGATSRFVELERRMTVTRVSVAGGRVTLRGRVAAPRAGRPVALTVQTSCTRRTRVATVRPRRDGTFTFTVPAPAGASGVIYRAETVVPRRARGPVTFATFTLPRPVRLG